LEFAMARRKRCSCTPKFKAEAAKLGDAAVVRCDVAVAADAADVTSAALEALFQLHPAKGDQCLQELSD
jgi:hypothetical protein